MDIQPTATPTIIIDNLRSTFQAEATEQGTQMDRCARVSQLQLDLQSSHRENLHQTSTQIVNREQTHSHKIDCIRDRIPNLRLTLAQFSNIYCSWLQAADALQQPNSQGLINKSATTLHPNHA